MNKAEFVEVLADKMEVTKAESGRWLETVIETIHENITKDEVKLSGLGSFSRVKRKARAGRNPQTGEEIKIPAKWAPVFKAGSQLKETVKKKK